MSDDQPVKKVRSLRATLLAIALVPSMLLLGSGIALSSVQLVRVLTEHDRAERLTAMVGRLDDLVVSVGDERRIAVRSFPAPDRPGLGVARQAVDVETAALLAALDAAASGAPASLGQGIQVMRETLGTLPKLRQDSDSGRGTRVALAKGYGRIQDVAIGLIDGAASASSFADVSEEWRNAELLLSAADLLDRSADVVVGASGRGVPTAEERAYAQQEYGGHLAEITLLEAVVPRLGAEDARRFESALGSSSHDLVAAMQPVLVAPQEPDAPPVDLTEYDAAATELGESLHELARTELTEAESDERAESAAAARTDILLAVALVALGVVVLITALTVTNRIVRRLTRLREDTQRRADHELPELMRQLRSGRRDQKIPELSTMDHGADEIGQVARAFEHAQRAAVDAAVAEARTRSGFNSVFLNIARRSQGVVHAQLRVLDNAERAEIDPDKLDRLFQLDHLATRERRNAENLIILGGGQLGRQWRDPIPVIDVVRSAVSEAVQYNQVSIGNMPPIRVLGEAVADVVHLLAELIDNATSFSPPQSVIDVRGKVVGHGMVVEIDDPGLGIEATRLDELNDLLTTSPEFSLLALSEDSQLGLFVVARLAHRHGIRVTLLDSAYGGIRAVVLLPESLLTGPADTGPATSVPALVVPAVADAAAPTPAPSPAPPAPTQAPQTATRPTALSAEPTEGRPALPRRTTQEPQLAEPDDAAPPTGNGADGEFDLTDDVAGQRHSSSLGALQQGTRNGRVEETRR